MKFTMLDNAIDSLKLTIDFFYSSLDCSDRELERLNKIIIIFLHNSIELLLKSILSKDDELSIYILENSKTGETTITKKILEEAQNLLTINPDKTLHEILIKDLNIQTIPYGTLIDKYARSYPCSKRTEIILRKLGKYRNAITHFGIDISEKEDEFYILIYNTFDVILYELYDQLLEIDDYFSYNDVIDNLESWLEGGEDYLRKLCVDNPEKKISIFTNVFQKTLFSNKLTAFLQTYDIKMDLGISNFDNNYFDIEFIYQDNEISLYSQYSTFHNATIFFDNENYIWFVIEHYDDNIYLYHSDSEYIPYPEEYRFWKNCLDKKCKCKPLTENNIRNHLVYMLRKTLLSYEI